MEIEMTATTKRLGFVAQLINAGFECKTANSWYCNLPKQTRNKTDNKTLIEQFKNWVKSDV
jgi:hypothetical protein